MQIKTVPWGHDFHRFTGQRTAERGWVYWLTSINRASLVMLSERKILDPETVRLLAEAEKYAESQLGDRQDAIEDIMPLEKLLIEKAGQKATLIHTGRSRQDIFATLNQGRLRNSVLDCFVGLNSLRSTLLGIAQNHIDTYIPAYTNGVQAMPISLAFYLWAFLESFERDSARIQSAWSRINRCALGTAVLACSSWPLDRYLLAELLGFDGPIVNGLDSSQVSLFDLPIEAASIMSNIAVRIGVMAQDLAQQYSQIHPWLLFDDKSAYGSSAMPQKRNPGILNKLRGQASDVIGQAHQVTIRSHNIPLGMYDNKEAFSEDDTGLFANTVYMLELAKETFNRLRVNKERALDELNNDWTGTMSLAEALQHEFGIPFRIGHNFASAIVTEARPNNFIPTNFPFEDAQRLFRAVSEKLTGTAAELPMTEVQFREALSPAHACSISKGLGAPNAESVRNGLQECANKLDADMAWVNERYTQLDLAEKTLKEKFEKLSVS